MTERQLIRQRQANKKMETILFIFGTVVILLCGITALITEIISFI